MAGVDARKAWREQQDLLFDSGVAADHFEKSFQRRNSTAHCALECLHVLIRLYRPLGSTGGKVVVRNGLATATHLPQMRRTLEKSSESHAAVYVPSTEKSSRRHGRRRAWSYALAGVQPYSFRTRCLCSVSHVVQDQQALWTRCILFHETKTGVSLGTILPSETHYYTASVCSALPRLLQAYTN